MQKHAAALSPHFKIKVIKFSIPIRLASLERHLYRINFKNIDEKMKKNVIVFLTMLFSQVIILV
jgi:hypothetical protein